MSMIVLFEKYFKKKFLQLYCPNRISPMGIFFLWEKPAATKLHYPTYGARLVL